MGLPRGARLVPRAVLFSALFAAARVTSAATGEAVLAPSGQPAPGTLTLTRAGSSVQIELGRGGPFVLPDAFSGADVATLQAQLVPALGVPPVRGRALWQTTADGPPRLRVQFPDGFVARGRLAPADPRLRAVLATGRVSREDRAEADAEAAAGGDAPSPEALVNFPRYRPLEVAADGRFGPLWLEAAPAWSLAAASPTHVLVTRIAPPRDVAIGAAFDLGTLTLQPLTGIAVTLDATGSGFRVKPVRRPDSREADGWYLPLLALFPELAESLYGEGAWDLVPGRVLRLGPLPPDSALDLLLEAPSGRRSAPVPVALRPGEVVPVVLHAAALIPADAQAGATLRGQVVLAGSNAPVADAEVDVWHCSPEGFYENQDPAQAEMNLRGKFRTDAAGMVEFVSVKPVGYPIPVGGPVGALLRKQGRHNMRPAHIHFLVHKPGYKTQFAQVYSNDDPNLDSDVQFGVTRALVGNHVRHAGRDPRFGESAHEAWYSLEHTLVIEPGKPRLLASSSGQPYQKLPTQYIIKRDRPEPVPRRYP